MMIQLTSLRRMVTGIAAIAAVLGISGANTGPITRLAIAPDADVVPLFEGVDSGRFQVRMVAADAYRSQVYITNTTGELLNVALPKAAVGVHVLPQFNGGFFGNQNNPFGNGQNANSNNGQNAIGMNGLANLAQSVGGQFEPSVTGMGHPPGGIGNGFPSLPPEMVGRVSANEIGGLAAVPPGRTIQLQLRTVCLNYGRPDPGPSLPYRLVRLEQFSRDPALAELLEGYSPRVNQQVMQAAAWHVANGIGWEQLERLPNRSLTAVGARLFTRQDVETARNWVQRVRELAARRGAAAAQTVAERGESP